MTDKAPPAFFNVTDMGLRAESPDGTVVTWSRLIARDSVNGRRPVTCDPPSGTLFEAGTTTSVTCTAKDRAGNLATTSFKVTIGAWSTVD